MDRWVGGWVGGWEGFTLESESCRFWRVALARLALTGEGTSRSLLFYGW